MVVVESVIAPVSVASSGQPAQPSASENPAPPPNVGTGSRSDSGGSIFSRASSSLGSLLGRVGRIAFSRGGDANGGDGDPPEGPSDPGNPIVPPYGPRDGDMGDGNDPDPNDPNPNHGQPSSSRPNWNFHRHEKLQIHLCLLS